MDLNAAASRSGFTLEHHETIGSTNDRAMDYLRDGGASRHFVVAREQRGGRGRLGRVWISEPGNLYASLALIDPAPQAFAFQLGFVASLAIYETLLASGVRQERISLKWPNDVLLDKQKISGILIEGSVLREGHIGVVIGCGVNVFHHPTDTLYPVTDLRASGLLLSVEEVFSTFSQAFAEALALYDRGAGFQSVRDKWLRSAHGLGGPIVVRDRNEERPGLFKGLDDEGRLLLEHSGHIEPVIAGDIFFANEGTL